MLSLWYCIGFSLVAAVGATLQLQYPGFSFRVVSLAAGLVVAASSSRAQAQGWKRRLSCSVACRILLGQGLNSTPSIGRQVLYNWTTREAPGFGSWINLKFLFHLLWHIAPYYVYDSSPGYEKGQWAQGQWRILPQEEEVWCQFSRCIWPQSWSVVSTRLWLLSKICGYFFLLFLFLKMCPLCLKK